MSVAKPLDFDHLLEHARALFPRKSVAVSYAADEVIYIDVDNHRYTFEIGSDDDAYVFTDGLSAFTIPLMENPEGF